MEGRKLEDGEYVAVFAGCYKGVHCSQRNPHITDEVCPIPVPADYKIIINNTDKDIMKGFLPVTMSDWPADRLWEGLLIDREHKRLLFGDRRPCPKDAPRLSATKIIKAYDDQKTAKSMAKQNEANAQRVLSNTRCLAQLYESQFKGVYQNIQNGAAELADDEDWKKLSQQPFSGWTTIEPKIWGEDQSKGRTYRLTEYEN